MNKVRDFSEERSRTLYVRLPHRIRDAKEVQELFKGNAKVKLPRQASRACHVIFQSVEEKVKGLKNLQGQTIDGKRIIALNPKTKPMENKPSRKKIVVPEPKQNQNVDCAESLFVSNISKKTTADDLKNAFLGCESVSMRNSNFKGIRSAVLKMESAEIAGEYLNGEKESPVLDGKNLLIKMNRGSKKSANKNAKSENLKIYDENGEATDKKFHNLSNKNSKKIKIVKDINEADNESDVDSGTE